MQRPLGPQNKESILAARILMVFSASIILTLGVLHLVSTFWGPSLTPRDPALQISMSQTSPIMTNETTMWRCWVGFNASHSMGLILFGLVFGYLALAHGQLLFRSPFLLVVGLAMLGGFVVLCKVYFFSWPLTGISISLACYVASIALSRFIPPLGDNMMPPESQKRTQAASSAPEAHGAVYRKPFEERVMAQYLAAIHLPEDFDPSAQDKAMEHDIDVLNEEMEAKGVRLFAGGLRPASDVNSLRVQPNGKVLITDGPCLETKEHIAGLSIFEAADMDGALAWARKGAVACRASGEVRAFFRSNTTSK